MFFIEDIKEIKNFMTFDHQLMYYFAYATSYRFFVTNLSFYYKACLVA